MASATHAGAGQAAPAARLSKVRLVDFKAIDELTLDLPAPLSPDIPDTFVLGSQNGVGKTSVLEAIAIGALSGRDPNAFQDEPLAGAQGRGHLREALVRSGASRAQIQLATEARGQTSRSDTEVTAARIATDPGARPEEPPAARSPSDPRQSLLSWILGWRAEPLIAPPLLLFHSFRKVREGAFGLATLTGAQQAGFPASALKLVLTRELMARGGLFEGDEAQTPPGQALKTLNALVERFAEGRIDKLRRFADGTLEPRVSPLAGGPSYSFDSLSSGQKEIITTLFLIWHATVDLPSLVLIDEPELHLNAEWQRLFVRTLHELAPWNQYILATHSEEIFASVDEDHRILIGRGSP